MKTITFIGFGAFGQAVARVLLKKQGLQVRAWDVQDTGQECQVKDVSDAVKDADVIFFAVPSQFFTDCIESIGGVLESSILITGTKGMDPKTNELPFEILKKQFPNNSIAVLSGPMLADELVAGKATSASIASDDLDVAGRIQELFKGTQVELEVSSDVMGVGALGVLKNVYVLALGLSDGLAMGLDFKALLVEKAREEMMIILERLGAKKESIDTPAGMGDFLATGYSTSSRNYKYGFGFAQGNAEEGSTVEGIKNINNLIARLENVSDLSFLSTVHSIFLQGSNPKQALESLVKEQ
ncbi:MAG: NAD(P)H-dependent glycerol-3-phosphate dehydrogenase [Patescibacteria group bacterium]